MFNRYKFTDKKHSVLGIISTILGLVASGLIVYAVYVSFKNAGEAGALIGKFGCLSFFLGIVGLVVGIKGFKKDDVFYLFCYIGTALNSACDVFLVLMLLIGV